jgi:GntR family transcriptional regulator, transcriptional repressor for pyruvate dehydrogenase complex
VEIAPRVERAVILRQHGDIQRAVRRRQPGAAERAMRAHIAYLQDLERP